MLTASPMRRVAQTNAIDTQPGIGDAATAERMVCPALRTRICTGRSWISREAVAFVSASVRGANGILPMLRARQSIAAAFGKVVHLAASAQDLSKAGQNREHGEDRAVQLRAHISVEEGIEIRVFQGERIGGCQVDLLFIRRRVDLAHGLFRGPEFICLTWIGRIDRENHVGVVVGWIGRLSRNFLLAETKNVPGTALSGHL